VALGHDTSLMAWTAPCPWLCPYASMSIIPVTSAVLSQSSIRAAAFTDTTLVRNNSHSTTGVSNDSPTGTIKEVRYPHKKEVFRT
jgi:hypothetical protein